MVIIVDIIDATCVFLQVRIVYEGMKKLFKKYWWILIIIVVVAAVAVKSKSSLLEVETKVVTTKSISRTVLSSGELVVKDEGMVYSSATGQIENVLVKEGQLVKKGQPILQLDSGSISSGVSQAESALLLAKKGQSALLDTFLTDAKKEALRAVMDNAGDARTRAQRDYDDDFTDTNKAILEAAINAHEAAEANYEAAMNAQPKKIDLDASQAGVDAAQKAYDEAKRTLGKSVVVASTDGAVSFVRDLVAEVASSGRMVTAGQLLATIATPSSIYFEVEVDETTIPLILLGLKTTVELDAFLGKTFKGSVEEISGHPVMNSNGSDVYLVQVRVDDPNAGFRQGMQGQAEFILETVDAVTVVPAVSVIVDGDEDIIYVLKDDNTVERRIVEVGVESATETQIVTGVKDGEQVIVSTNVRDLKDGQSVRLANANE